jgi:hypothetical protein
VDGYIGPCCLLWLASDILGRHSSLINMLK